MKRKKRTQGPTPSMLGMVSSNKGIHKALKVCLSEIDALVYFELAYNKIRYSCIFLHSGLTKPSLYSFYKRGQLSPERQINPGRETKYLGLLKTLRQMHPGMGHSSLPCWYTTPQTNKKLAVSLLNLPSTFLCFSVLEKFNKTQNHNYSPGWN